MTKEEFIAKYGDVKVTFDYYYKYTFSFSGTCDNGHLVLVYVGGDSLDPVQNFPRDDIYRIDVDSNPIAIKNLSIVAGEVQNNGNIVDSFYVGY